MNDDLKVNGWAEWSKHVLLELQRLAKAQEDTKDDFAKAQEALKEEITKIKINIAMLQIKSGIWGAIGGAIPVSILVAWMFIKK